MDKELKDLINALGFATGLAVYLHKKDSANFPVPYYVNAVFESNKAEVFEPIEIKLPE